MSLLDAAQFLSYLDALGQHLAYESPCQDVTHRFHVADMVEPNALGAFGTRR